mmetsp:Transcript_36875/g.62135  ORF Transcript_36875/g.62135 Transcript_36875/m.62135 type:complete len:112 (+) Transcript_36875:20-355(+)
MGVCGSTELSQLPTEVQQALDKFAETYSPEMPLVFMITTSTPVFQFQGDAKVLNSSILPQCRKVMESLQIPIKEKKNHGTWSVFGDHDGCDSQAVEPLKFDQMCRSRESGR